MSLKQKADRLVEQAKELAPRVNSWAEFSNKLFAQDEGLVAKTFPKMKDRQAFYDMPQYAEVNQILLGLIKRFGVAEGAVANRQPKEVATQPSDSSSN
jgi:hypothetical protein